MAAYSSSFGFGTNALDSTAVLRGRVVIVWDYENCPVPSGMSGFTAARMIRKAALQFGSVDHFEAYSYWSNSPNSLLKQELSVSGVKLRDCPHNGKKDVVDKTIIIDMIFYAMERPPTTTLLLISGDRDYSYAISTLQNRGYSVKLLAPVGCLHSNLPLIADVLDWETVLNLAPRQLEAVDAGVSITDLEQDVEVGSVAPDLTPSPEASATQVQEEVWDLQDEAATWGELPATRMHTASRCYDLNFPPLPSLSADQWSPSPTPLPITAPRMNSIGHTYSAPTVLPIFEDLVAELNSLHLAGYSAPLWGMVSEGLTRRDRNIFMKAGVGRFKQYVEMAQACGIVCLSLVPSGQETIWLALRR
ncbi:hypothetical protein FRB90_010789 [Tulasnella sp. 427]|nr:hypothetical protein FRB90_010789 [Tulasnella sp. 427]